MSYSQELRPSAVRDIISFCEAGTIRDIIDFANGIKGDIKTYERLYNGSIAKRSAQLVLVFPVLVSSSINLKTAIIISKAIERRCVAMLQLLFSAINLTSYKDTKDLFDYISKFHSNLDMPNGTLSLDEFINIVNSVTSKHENLVIDKEMYNAVINEMKTISTVAKAALNEHSINDYKVRRSNYGGLRVTLEADGDDNGITDNKSSDSSNDSSSDEDRSRKSAIFKSGNYDKQVINIDKANELVPTMMTISFSTVVDGNIVQRTGLIGVKAKFYPVEGSELRARLSNKYRDSQSLFQFIRASTGELSFWKDIVFAFDKLKKEAISTARGSTNARLFNLLQNRADKNNSFFFNKGNNNPITTLVIDQQEVELLKKESNIDLTKPNIYKTIFDGYNLMGLVIVDDSTESAKFLFDDGSDKFETISYTALQRENKDQGTITKLVNILQRGGRV